VKVRWLFTLFVCAACAQTVDLPRTIQQGNTLRIRGSGSAVAARMNDRTIRLFPQGSESLGLMPVPADQKPGDYKVDLLDKEGTSVASVPIRVIDAHFPKQNVVIEQSLADLKPSPGETETVTSFRNAVSEMRYWSEPLALPVRGCMTSPFGVQRYMNGKPTGNFHGGLDQRSPAGTPVHAVDAGIVKIVRDWNLHGQTVGIDHGQGLESMYLHMSKLAVAEGAAVRKGDVVGYVGSTGRSTAPHLHWSLYVNGVPVNPRDWVQSAPCSAARKAPTNGQHGGGR
jgi:murein DD-endopeptidase MepM/ murein hydrolase activator NlpD